MATRSEGLTVFVRVRPPILKEVTQEFSVFAQGPHSLTVTSENKETSCSYDHVFNEVSDQSQVFEKVKPLLVDVLSGINSCIFAYGQTSAGKSYTMIGPNGGMDILKCDKKLWGILPRASEFLLGYLNEKSRQGLLSYEVKASFLQIYNENLYDLLRDSGPSMEETLIIHAGNDEELKIREVPVARAGKESARVSARDTANEVFVSGLSEFRVQTSDDILRILAVGTSNRATRSTDFNLTSSRSHAILQLTFSIESHMKSGQTLITRSKLNLVDLAGSEKIPYYMSETNSQKHVKELTSINKSLSCLGNVISALTSTNRSHIPFRDSKLTRLLQDSLSGNTRTILIACVAPTILHTAESLSTLQFADRARNVMLSVKANTVVDDKALLAKAQAEITRLKAMLTSDKGSDMQKVSREKVEEEIERILSENEGLRKENEKLLKRMNSNTRITPLASVNNSYQSIGESPATSNSVSQKSWDPTATLAYALYDYTASEEDELSFQKGDTLQVLETYDDDWWLVANKLRDQGLAPSNYFTLDKVLMTSPPREKVAAASLDVQLPESPEMRRLKELREKTESKMNALKLAVSASPVRPAGEPKRSISPALQSSGATTPRGEYSAKQPESQKPTKPGHAGVNRSLEFPAQNNKMPQVALDQGSLNFISKVINERLSKEFDQRDERIISQVSSMLSKNGIAEGPRRKISNDSAPDENSAMMMEGVEPTPPSSVYNSTKGKSKIPRVFPKINDHHVKKVDSFDDNQSVSSRDSRKKSPRGGPSSGMIGSASEGQSPTVEDAINKLPMLKNPYANSSKKNKAAAPKSDALPLEDMAASPSEIHSSSDNKPVLPSRINEVSDAGLQYANCRSIVYPPSTFLPHKAPPKGPPDASLQLQHVYGYSGSNVNSKAQILSDNRVIFPAASVVVVMDPHDRRQSFFTGHKGDVTCFTLHSSRRIVASAGHISKDSGILIWDSSSVTGGTSSQSVVMELKLPRGVKSIQGMSFSPDNKYLAVNAIDESRSLLIYEIMHGHLVAQSKIGLVEVTQVCFNPFQFATRLSDNYESTSIGCYTLYSFGGKQIKLWTLKVQVGDLPDSPSSSGKSPLRSVVQIGNGEAKIHHTLEGGVGVITAGGVELQITSVVAIDDSSDILDDEGNFVDVQPKSRLLCGTSNGSVVIYQQLEEVIDPSNPIESAAFSWQPKGKVVSVVTEVHDCSVLDVSYISSGHAPGKQNFKPFERVLTSGVDGSLNLWEIIRSSDSKMLPLEHIFACELENKEVVRSIAWDVSGDMAVVGTTNNSLVSLLFSAADTVTTVSVTTEDILSCHQNKIKRVAVNPVVGTVFVTIGNDKYVRLWESTALRQIGCFELPFSATAICFDPEGKTLAIGNEQGEFCIYTCTEFAALMGQSRKKIISMLCAPVSVLSLNNWVLNFKRNVTTQGASPQKFSQRQNKSKHCDVTEIKFSPSGLVAVGCKDNLIHILTENGAKMNVYKHSAVCRGHSSFIKNLDFSADGSVLQSTDAARELLHWDVASGSQLTNASDFRDAEWSTWSCIYGWPVHGVCNDTTGRPSVDGDVHCVTRSPDSKLVLAGNNHNSANCLKLFNYPCLGDAVPNYYEGHSSPVQDVAFLASSSKHQKDLKAISVGSGDACIFQWQVVKN